MKRSMLVGLVTIALSSCALFSKGEVSTRRYYSPDLPLQANADMPQHRELQLRLARVSANRTLAERMMTRRSEHEVSFDDDRVWTERPDAYLSRAVTKVFFEERGLKSIVGGGPGPTLEVELLRFEEVNAPIHVARVRIAFALSDENVVSLQKTINVERPIGVFPVDQSGAGVAASIGEALRAAVTDLSIQVIEALSKTKGPSNQ